MLRTLKLYLPTFAAFLALDAVWLGVVANGFYIPRLEAAGFAIEVDYAVALLFYALFCVGLCVFAVAPALASGGPRRAAALGALFGLVSYATYDLTNLATLRDWPLTVAVVDMAWGALLGAAAAWAGALGARRLGL